MLTRPLTVAYITVPVKIVTLIEQKRVQEKQMTAKDALAGTTNTNVVAGVSDGKRATQFIVFGELAKGIEKVEQ